MTEPSTPPHESHPPLADEANGAESLRGTMTAVLLLGAFLVATWSGVLLLHVLRR